jgi:hypothetical protein
MSCVIEHGVDSRHPHPVYSILYAYMWTASNREKEIERERRKERAFFSVRSECASLSPVWSQEQGQHPHPHPHTSFPLPLTATRETHSRRKK